MEAEILRRNSQDIYVPHRAAQIDFIIRKRTLSRAVNEELSPPMWALQRNAIVGTENPIEDVLPI
jgi:hypothetical protein